MISVIVPIYNVEKYIHRCVNSILNQTFKDFELILVDDGSPDNCGNICDEYAKTDNRIIVIHKQNGGLSDARNAGIETASGDWMCFIDSDDWVHEKYLELLYKSCIDNNVLISQCNYLRTDGIQNITLEEDFNVTLMTPEELWCAGNVNDAISPCNKIFKSELCKTDIFPTGKIHEDVFTIHKYLFQCDKVAVISTRLYYYFLNPNSITGKGWYPARMDAIGAFRDQTEYFHNKGFDKAEAVSAWKYFETLDSNLIQIKGKSEYKKLYRRLMKEAKGLLKNKKILLSQNDAYDYICHRYFPVKMRISDYFFAFKNKLIK